ncbi:MAG: outer membrane protein assembly factor BamA [Bacteroidota bacterium]
MRGKWLLIVGFFVLNNYCFGQITIGENISVNYSKPKEYEIGGITVSGIKYLDTDVLINLSGLTVGDIISIPGEETADAIRKLWKQGLFSDVEIKLAKVVDNRAFIDIFLQERPRLSKFSFSGIKKSDAEDLREMIKLVKGSQVTDNMINTSKNIIKNYYVDKGFYKTTVDIVVENDTNLLNNVVLNIKIDKFRKIKINKIQIEGNSILSDNKLRRSLKETKQKTWYNVFKASKYTESDYKADKLKLISKYNEFGFRDAHIISDTIYDFNEKTMNIEIIVDEGSKYYFRNITWVGNTKYKSEYLAGLTGIKKGDIYNQKLLDENLYMNPNGVFSLYQDNGYLFSSVTPVEIYVSNDSIDIEMRVYEGKPARVSKVTIVGNTKTNDHVVRREIKSKPGELYSRADITRTIRELAQLGYFDPEKLNLNPTPNPADGTVDLEYVVEEKPSDQIELSGGWGANMIVGTLGVSFNNFSAKNFFKKNAWTPLPSGDGQRLSLRAQSNGAYYQSYNMSFVEPWLGGKKPMSLSTSVYHTILTTSGARKYLKDSTDTEGNTVKYKNPNYQSMKITGIALGLGTRLSWPDDYFTLYHELSYQNYLLDKYTYRQLFSFSSGESNNISYKIVFGRNSIDAPIYPRRGSMFSVSLQITPPYSIFSGKDYTVMSDADKYKFIEYHKWKFESSWFSKLAGNLVINTRAEFGFLGMFNPDYGPSPFEGFNLGGDGLVTYSLYGMETIALRGYENGSLTPDAGGNIYNKYTVEMRYPISLNPNATLYALAFMEGGSAWSDFKNFNPFDIHRSAGVGVRIFLPMFGKLGVDWGYGFDPVFGNPNLGKSQFHFIIGQNF